MPVTPWSTSVADTPNCAEKIAAFYAPDDRTQHVILGSSDGNIREIFFSSAIGTHVTPPIANIPNIRALGAFYAEDDRNRYVIVADQGGEIFQLRYNSNVPINKNSPPLTTVSDLVGLAAFYSPDDHMRHAIVATKNGDITELFWGANNELHVSTPPLANFPDVISIAAFYTPDDQTRHVIVATRDGAVHEIFYGSSIGAHVSEPALAQFAGIVSVAGFYTPDDKFRHVIVATQDGAVHEVFYGSSIGAHVSEPALAVDPATLSVAAYYTPADHMRHAIVEMNSRDVREIFYNSTGVGNDLLAQLKPDLAVTDFSPDTPNGTSNIAPDSAGLTVNLAGNAAALYAVSLNAGVWKSTAGSAWARLPNSPRYAYSIAIDPNNASHIAVGERGGDAIDHHADGAGLWESSDAGASWQYSLDPLSVGCPSQAIPSVAFSKASTLFVATTCGIGRKLASASSFDFGASPPGIGPVTALTTSPTRVWARTLTRLLISTDDGQSWSQKQIPAGITFPNLGDNFSLAAFDSAAYMTCCQSSTPPCGNLDQLLVYSVAQDAFTLQPNTVNNGAAAFGCSGTGLGGSRFVKAFPVLVKKAKGQVVSLPHLFYGSGQEVYEAAAFNPDGTVQNWSRPLGASCSGCTNQDKVHSDIWDFLLTPDGKSEWVSNDGGVYGRSTAPSDSWKLMDAGLHTHHIHTLTLLGSGPNARIVYVTSDDDSWFWNAQSGFAPISGLGDSNWSAGDAASNSAALLVRRTGACRGQSCALLTGFGATLPGGQSLVRAQLNNDGQRDGPEIFNFIQSLATESPAPFALDAVMLANLPLEFLDATGALQNVPGPLGQPSAKAGPVLLRNTDFASTPDIDVSKGQGWKILAGNLPAGAQGFWVSGGHSHPVFYLLTVQGGQAKLYRSQGLASPKFIQWQELNVRGAITQPKPYPPSGMLGLSATYGPVFVDPYDPNDLYVLTNTGVQVSTNGGMSFSADSVLTNLITGNGKYPLTGSFGGGDWTNVRIPSRAVRLGTLSDMGFCRSNPRLAVATSAFAGAFYRDAGGTWHTLSNLLPRPQSSVSSARIDCQAIYLATEGGGVTRVDGYGNVP